MDGRMWSSRGRATLKILREQNDPDPVPQQEEATSSSHTAARPASVGRSSFRPQKRPTDPPTRYAPSPLLERTSAPQQGVPTPPLVNKGRSRALNLMSRIKAQRAAISGESVMDNQMQSVMKGVENLTVLPSTSESGDAKKADSGRVVSNVRENIQSKRSEPGSTYIPKDVPTDTFGSFGNQIRVKTNYLEVYFKEEKLVYLYNTIFEPDNLDTVLQQKLLNRHFDVLSKEMLFCGNCICTPFELKQQKFEFTENLGSINVKIQVHFLKKTKLSEWMNPMNLIFQKVMDQLQLVKINNKMFDPKTKQVLSQHRLEIWKGYDVAIKDCKKGVLLSCDLAHSILRLDNVWDMYMSILMKYQNNLSQHAMDEFKSSIISSTIITRYNNNSYRINDVDFELTPESKFRWHDSEISYMQYYNDTYGLQIKDSKQPLLVHIKKVPTSSGKKRIFKIILIPELCFMTGIDEKTRADFKIMKDISQFTWSKPNDRYIAIQVLINRIYDCAPAVEILQTWGVNISNEPITTNARVITNNNIIFRNKSCDVVRGGWSRESGYSQVLEGVALQQWLIIVTQSNRSCMQNLIREFCTIGAVIGIPVSRPIEKVLENDYLDTFLRAIRNCSSMQMVVIISPTSRTDRYNAIKKLCCVELGIPSQVINARTISRKDKLHTIAVKILLQMNCKLGGELWKIDMPVQTSGTMFCGMDVYHNTKDRKASVVGFVSSTNVNATSWFSNVHRQYCGQELIDFLCQSIAQSIQIWQEKNNSYPKRIIIYRDGISSGMLSNVRELEVESLLRGIGHSVGHTKIPLTFIITNKRISTRIFLEDRSLENAPVGTVLDNTITTNKWYDFFMVSQHALQGTVCPAHYIVAYDDSHLKPDHIQALTLKLCHLYYNWTGTISVPAPCKYAHKLAQLVGQNIQCDKPSDFLSDKLYYL